MNLMTPTPITEGLQWNARWLTEKVKRVISDPRLINDKLLVPRSPASLLATASRWRYLPPFRTAVTLSRLWDWNRLMCFIKAIEHPVFLCLSDYLHQTEQHNKGVKERVSRSLRETIKKHAILERLNEEELWDASRLLTQFGFFDAAIAFRLAALARLLTNPSTNELMRQQATLELAGMTTGDIQSLSDGYGLEALYVLMTAHQQGQNFSVSDILDVYRRASDSWLQEMREKVPPQSFRTMIDLRARATDLRGQNILLIGPSARESEPINSAWPDLVARIGYVGESSTVEGEVWPTDICFYRDHKLNDLTKEEMQELFESRTIFVSNLKPGTLSRLPKAPNLYYSRFAGNILMGKEANAGPETLLCLLDAGVNHIHITHMDLLLNTVYPPGYIRHNVDKRVSNSGKSLETETKCRSMALNHPPTSQFSLIKIFWKHGMISADEFLTNILECSLRDYCSMLEAAYHPFECFQGT